jgi:hypothetical protein
MDKDMREKLSKNIAEIVMDGLPDDQHRATHFLTVLRTLIKGYTDQEDAPSIVMLCAYAGDEDLQMHGINADTIRTLSMLDFAHKSVLEEVLQNAPSTDSRH